VRRVGVCVILRWTAEGWWVVSLEPKSAADASMGELMSQLSSQTSRLVRDEMRLAQKEFQEAAKHAGIGAGLFSVAGLLAFFGFATLITAAIAGLAVVLPVWAAALIIAVVLFAVAGIAALLSKKQVDEVSPPRQTIESIKKDIDEVKDATP
jgi:Flp pilus assembly protein TadB